jgi:hypothetical protein
MQGPTLDLDPATDEFAPFTVVADPDVCLVPCEFAEEQCYGYERQLLEFSYDGDPLVTVWSQSDETVTVDGTEFRITAMAQGAIRLNPVSWCDDQPGYDHYAFRIEDVTP